jgi:dihydropteroate synthase
MGVLNITPNSFSDGKGTIPSLSQIQNTIKSFGPIDALDIGAESTAPMNQSITSEKEWARIEPILPFFKSLRCSVSVDTYHPETIEKIARIWLDEKLQIPLIWNDVSGKFDSSVKYFLSLSEDFSYVFCHNLSPERKLSGRHMDYVSLKNGEEFIDELVEYFAPHRAPQVIFDPTLGFSKTFEQNWLILDRFSDLQQRIGEADWLIGFSRKSFLRKKFDIQLGSPDALEKLDLLHQNILEKMKPSLRGVVWVRSHRPDLIV